MAGNVSLTLCPLTAFTEVVTDSTQREESTNYAPIANIAVHLMICWSVFFILSLIEYTHKVVTASLSHTQDTQPCL